MLYYTIQDAAVFSKQKPIIEPVSLTIQYDESIASPNLDKPEIPDIKKTNTININTL